VFDRILYGNCGRIVLIALNDPRHTFGPVDVFGTTRAMHSFSEIVQLLASDRTTSAEGCFRDQPFEA
jgi:hypothetical protein